MKAISLRHCNIQDRMSRAPAKRAMGYGAARFTLYHLILKLARDDRAQDLVEYALLTGFIAVAAGALLPPVADSISIIFSKVRSISANVAQQ